MSQKKPITGIHYQGNGQFEEIDIDRDAPDGWEKAVHKLTGARVLMPVSAVMGPFAKPFAILADERGHLGQPPSAIIIDLSNPAATNAMFGRALIFRRAGDGITSVKPGDLDLVRQLPCWIRFDRFERRRPTHASQLEASGTRWDPQISLTLTGPERQQEVFVNTTLARFEYEIMAFNVGRMGPVTQFELMLQPEAVKTARAFVRQAFDDEGNLTGPWAEIG